MHFTQAPGTSYRRRFGVLNHMNMSRCNCHFSKKNFRGLAHPDNYFFAGAFCSYVVETTHDVGGPLTIIANPLLFVALIIVLRKLGLNGTLKRTFY